MASARVMTLQAIHFRLTVPESSRAVINRALSRPSLALTCANARQP